MKNKLTFHALRKANTKRLPQFKNSKGKPAHSKPDGSDWSPAQWLQAVVGEIGEYSNIRKKFERGDMSENEFKIEATKEIADIQIYLDILAFRLGINLSDAIIDKFNEVSERVNSSVFFDRNGKVISKKRKIQKKQKNFINLAQEDSFENNYASKKLKEMEDKSNDFHNYLDTPDDDFKSRDWL